MSLAARLEEGLRARALIPDARTQARVASAVHALGVERRDALARRWGPLTTRRLYARMDSVDAADDVAWAAGYGAAITDHLIAPVDLGPADARAVVELGALANVIVFLHDNLADAGASPALLLPPGALALAASPGRRGALAAWAALAPPAPRVLATAVLDWSERLDLVATPPVAERTREAVARMYAAQQELLRDGARASEGTLRAKSALPFVTMALPAWGRAAGDARAREAHLAWVGWVGELLGRVDDAVDIEEDAQAGAPNLAARAFAAGRGDAWIEDTLALAEVAARGWREGARTVFPRDVTGPALMTCVASWLRLNDDY